MTRPTLVEAGRTTPGRRLVVVTAGLSDPSSTRLLADLLSAATEAALADRGGVEVEVVELRPLAHALTDALLTGFATGDLARAQDSVATADGLVVVTPVFSGSYSGLFKTFFDVLEPATLEDTPVLVAATAGTARHSLVLEYALRPLFAYLRAAVVPTAVFAASEDWGSTEGGAAGAGALRQRVDRAAAQLADAMASRPALHRADPFGDVPDFSTLLGG